MIKKILVSQPRPATEKSPYFDMEREYGVQVDFRQLIKVEELSPKEFRAQHINPGKPIPYEVQQLTGITNEDVAGKPSFKELARTLEEEFKGCDFAGFNSNNFDISVNFWKESALSVQVNAESGSRLLIFLQSVPLIMIKTLKLQNSFMQLFRISFILQLQGRLQRKLFMTRLTTKKNTWV